MTDALTTQIEAADDPAKTLGTRESWSGTDVFVLRNARGHFVTWRHVTAAEAAEAPAQAVADGGDAIEFVTDNGADVTVTADSGSLRVNLTSDDLSFETKALIGEVEGRTVLKCGRKRTDDGTKINALVPVDGRVDELEQLREASKSDEPLRFEVVERTKSGSWGQTITNQRLKPTKSHAEWTDAERELGLKVDTDHDVPEDAEAGDVFALDDLLDDTRTAEEKDQAALDEAAETGEEVVISKSTTDCNDASKECNLDHVTRVATPDGDIETRRTHTY